MESGWTGARSRKRRKEETRVESRDSHTAHREQSHEERKRKGSREEQLLPLTRVTHPGWRQALASGARVEARAVIPVAERLGRKSLARENLFFSGD